MPSKRDILGLKKFQHQTPDENADSKTITKRTYLIETCSKYCGNKTTCCILFNYLIVSKYAYNMHLYGYLST